MGAFAGLLAELFLLFEDFKFWLKRRKQRQFDRQHGLPKAKALYPSQRIYIIALLILLPLTLIMSSLLLSKNSKKQTEKKLSEVSSLLKHEKTSSGNYPEQLETIIRNNPLLKNVNKDYWDQEFFYERHASGESYVLISLGKDGKLSTEDDIKHQIKID